MRPAIRYLTTADGVRLAYAVHGDGPPLVHVRGWMSHLDLFWEDMEFRAFFEAIGTRFRVVRYDMRGTGLSDRDVTDRLSLDELILDLDAVFDHLGLEEAVLYATCYGGPITVEWAARNPSRVSKLVLDGTYASGPQLGTPDMRESVRTAARLLGAPTTAAAGHAMLAYFTRPDGMDTRDARFRRTRQSINADVAEALYNLSFEWDVTAACESITVPTLVTHRRESHAVPVRLGRELASLLPNAELVTFPGADHNPWEGDALEPLRAMARFLGEPIDLAYRRRARLRPTIVLFTDMEGSTSNAARLGDATAQELMRANKRIVETGLDDHGGKRVKSTGDGLMAEFGSVSQALMAAAAIQAAVAAHNAEHPDASFRLRMGVNAGEPLAEDDDLHGIVVHTAARICDNAHGGEVLVSNVVRELATGKDFRFADAGVFDVKGLDEPIRLFRLVT
jgi:class 3 adenylate cyclase